MKWCTLTKKTNKKGPDQWLLFLFFAGPTLSFVVHSSIVNYVYVCKYSSLLDQFLLQILLTAICKDHDIHSITNVHWEVFINNGNRDRPNIYSSHFQSCTLQSVIRCMNISSSDVLLQCTVCYIYFKAVPLIVGSVELHVSMKNSQAIHYLILYFYIFLQWWAIIMKAWLKAQWL